LLPTVNKALKIQNTALKIFAVFAAALIDIATLPIRILATPIELVNRVGLNTHKLREEFKIGSDVEHVKVFISMVKKVPNPQNKQHTLFNANVGVNINLKRCYSYKNEDASYRDYTRKNKWQHHGEKPNISTIDTALKFMKLKANSTEDEIKKAYKRLALALHPDKDISKEEEFKKLNAYYHLLLDPTTKVPAAYQ